MANNYTRRPNVIKYLPHWQQFVRTHGKQTALEYLQKGKTKFIDRKDRLGLIYALGLLEGSEEN